MHRLVVSCIVAVLLVCMTLTVSASEMSSKAVAKVLAVMSGQWYDSDGNLVLDISGIEINGCSVISGFDFAGSNAFGQGKFRIAEKQGYRDIDLAWKIGDTQQDRIVLDRMLTLHKDSTKAEHYESVGGVYLGMSQKQLISMYGMPSKIYTSQKTKLLCGVNMDSWCYLEDGWLVTFDGDVSDRIVIFYGGTRKFDRTGFNCQNSIERYAEVYGAKESNNMYIGHGEYLNFDEYPRSILFSIYGY